MRRYSRKGRSAWRGLSPLHQTTRGPASDGRLPGTYASHSASTWCASAGCRTPCLYRRGAGPSEMALVEKARQSRDESFWSQAIRKVSESIFQPDDIVRLDFHLVHLARQTQPLQGWSKLLGGVVQGSPRSYFGKAAGFPPVHSSPIVHNSMRSVALSDQDEHSRPEHLGAGTAQSETGSTIRRTPRSFGPATALTPGSSAGCQTPLARSRTRRIGGCQNPAAPGSQFEAAQRLAETSESVKL